LKIKLINIGHLEKLFNKKIGDMVFFTRLFIVLFITINCHAVVSVGDSYGGGTVFCVSDTLEGIKDCRAVAGLSGSYGLIMANEDQANYYSNFNHGVTWSQGSSLTYADSDSDGAVNTQTIIDVNFDDDASNSAAWLCQDYRDPEGHKDWYLPASAELDKMYVYAKANNLIGENCTGSKADGIQCLIGGGEDNDLSIYWSSTEYHREYSSYIAMLCAGYQYFNNGVKSYCHKSQNYYGVRAIRMFGSLALDYFNLDLLNKEEQRMVREGNIKILGI